MGDVISSSFISLLYIKGTSIKWAEDNPPVNVIFLICMSKSHYNSNHIKSIAFIANLFENNEFTNILKILNSSY